MSKAKAFILPLLAATALTGCASVLSVEARHDVATDIAAAAHMTEHVIPAGLFNLTTFEKIGKPGAPAHIYIEGDGLAWLSRNKISMNPTPSDPTTLHLAALDPADNVIYIARPCQYSGWNGGGPCPDKYWTNARTAPEVVQAFKIALDDIKTRHNITAFDLTGYSGGGGVAVLAAADRSDITSIRTAAGNIDYATFTNLHRISPMDASTDPISVAAKVAHIPQMHFIGGDDTVIPKIISDSWLQASNNSCVHAMTITGVAHGKGWAVQWPSLLNIGFSCK